MDEVTIPRARLESWLRALTETGDQTTSTPSWAVTKAKTSRRAWMPSGKTKTSGIESSTGSSPAAVVRIEGKPIPHQALSATQARDKFQSVLSKDQTHERSGKALAVELAEFWDWGGPKKMGWESAEAYMNACLTTIKTRRTLYRAIAYGRAQWHLKSVTHGSHFAKLPERTLRPVIEVAGDDPDAMLTVLEEAWSLACNDQKGQRAVEGRKKQPPRMTSGHTRRAVEAIYGRQGASESEAALDGEISRRARDWREFSKMIDKCLQIAQFHGGHEALMERLDWCSNFAQERIG